MTQLFADGVAKTTRPFLLPSCLMLIATLFSVAMQGFDYPTNNNVFHIPIIFDYANSVEGPSDTFHQSLSRYVSGFWIAVSFLVTETNVFYVFLGIHIAIRFLTVFMVWQISGLIAGRSPISALFCCFILFFPPFLSFSPVGRSEILIHYLTHSQAVIPVVLCSWFLLLKRRFLISAAILAIAFNINAFVGVWGGLVAGIAMVSCLSNEKPIHIIKMAAKMLGLFVLVASPVILWIIHSTMSISPHEAFSYREYLRDYFPHHTFVDTHLRRTTSMFFVIITSFLALKYISVNWSRKHRRLMFSILSTYSAIFIAGMILPYITDSRLLLNLFPLRMDSYIIFLLAIILLSWCIKSFHTAEENEKAYSFVALLSLINGNIALLLVTFILGTEFHSKTKIKIFAPLLLLFMGIMHVTFGSAPVLAPRGGVIAAISLILQSGIIAFVLPRKPAYFERAFLLISTASLCAIPEVHGIIMRGVILLVYVVLVLSLVQRKEERVLIPVPAIIAALIAALIFLVLHSKIWSLIILAVLLLPTIAVFIIPLIKKYSFSYLKPDTAILSIVYVLFLIFGATLMSLRGGISRFPEASRALTEVQLWARNNTPPHTVFLPVGINNFSTLSRRPVWIDWKIGAMVMWAPETHELWSTRWKQLKRLRSVTDAKQLARNEGIDFIVFRKRKISPGNLPRACIAYENKIYWVMQPCEAFGLN